jgi:hypothetical protein
VTGIQAFTCRRVIVSHCPNGKESSWLIGAEILVTEIGGIGVAFDSFCVYVCGRQIKPYFAVIAYDTNTSTDLTDRARSTSGKSFIIRRANSRSCSVH